MLFPVSNLIIKLAKKISGVKDDERDDSVVSLDDRMLQTPSLALQATVGEVARMGEIVNDTLDAAKRVLFTLSEEDIHTLKEDESKVDKLTAESQIMQSRLPDFKLGKGTSASGTLTPNCF